MQDGLIKFSELTPWTPKVKKETMGIADKI